MNASLWTRLSYLALLLWQGIWHGWLHPANRLPWLALALAVVPMLLGLRAVWRGTPRSLVWPGLFVLALFCHATMEAWADPTERWAALVAVALTAAFYASIWPLAVRVARERKAQRAAARERQS